MAPLTSPTSPPLQDGDLLAAIDLGSNSFHMVVARSLLGQLRVVDSFAQSDMVGVVASEVANYYASHGLLSVLPMDMPCHMDAFGLITRTDRLLSPGAKVMMKVLKQTCLTQYGIRLSA